MPKTEKRFAVIVRYESENPANQFPPDVYWHHKPAAAARRLSALINRRAKWVPKRTIVGTRFYIVDHASPQNSLRQQMSLTFFREEFELGK